MGVWDSKISTNLAQSEVNSSAKEMKNAVSS